MQKEKDVAKFYKKKQVESATPGQLVILLYDAAIDNINKGEAALKETGPGRFEKYHNALIMAQNAVTELTVSLDLEKGGDIAQNLLRLYDYMTYRLIDANMNKTDEPLIEVRNLLVQLKGAWVQVIKEEKTENLSPPKKHLGLNLKG
jgi:flagellar protein FliS